MRTKDLIASKTLIQLVFLIYWLVLYILNIIIAVITFVLI